jgi:hypothetical protein
LRTALEALVLALVMALAVELAGCTPVQKAATGAAATTRLSFVPFEQKAGLLSA